MNKTQKEVLQSQLNTEKKTINELKQVYTQALKDCETKIRELSSRTDMENLQSIIYQKQYQEALKGQLEGVLANLQSNSFATVSEYLTKCYQEGYTGVMYDLMNQGIPLIMPIDQEAVVKAIQTDSKISTSLYTKMGEDVKHLKNSIRAELSRGIANGSTWNEMAAKMAVGFKNTPFSKAYNNTIRIARTEGHRVSIQSAMDAQHKAKEKGADVVKQWDSTLDGKTRPTHRQLDGQIREIDDDFEVGGRKVKAPGMFGDPAEDCNCRCALLQRAKWALDEEELNTLKQRAEYFGLDKSKDFDDFKSKYLKISDEDIKGADSGSVRSNAQKINQAINEQIELLKKYGNETNILFNGSPEELINWDKLKKITNKSGTELLSEMSKSADNWETVLNMQSENTLKSFINQLLDVATDEELSALNLWSGESYANINRYMRFGISVDDISKNAAKKIESVLDKITTKEEIIVHRGTGTKHIFEKIKGDWKSDPTFLIGQSFSDAGFVATSPLKEGGFSGVGGSQAELFIKVPQGTHGAYIAKQAHNENEKEFLLQRGYSYRIIKAEYRENPIFPDEKDLKVWCEVILDD